MKFKVTATIPIELEIDCQSKEEALDTATTILQEQRDDGDYASIVADCIESALVSGSITMTAVDNHEALVNELRTKRKISIQDMDAFLGYEIDKNDDMMFDDDYINVNLWMMDVDKALGLDVCTSDNDEYVTISVNWYPKAAEHEESLEKKCMYEVVDGKQRLMTLCAFYENRFPYRGCFYNELSAEDKNWFGSAMTSLASLSDKVTKKDVLEVFVALNQNGRPIEEAVLNHAKKLLDDIR